MNSKTKMRYTSQKGITLIALVITIIVLLILAGVTLSMVLGDDGIIAQAQKAKETYETKEVEEQDGEKDLAANVSRYQKGTAENLAKTGELKVGDYVNYTYTESTYTTPTGNASVYENTQTFNSGGESKITEWRVLSANNGRIKLIAAEPTSKLTLIGENGWINGSTVLNEMCETLYSGEYGTARSITLEDAEEAMGVTERKIYDGNNEITMSAAITKMNELAGAGLPRGFSINDFTYNYTSVGRETQTPGVMAGEGEKGQILYVPRTSDSIARHSIFNRLLGEIATDKTYWVATPTINFDTEYMKFRQYFISNGTKRDDLLYNSGMSSRHLWNPKEGTQTDVPTDGYCVRPIVELKPGLKVEKVGEVPGEEIYGVMDETRGIWKISN